LQRSSSRRSIRDITWRRRNDLLDLGLLAGVSENGDLDPRFEIIADWPGWPPVEHAGEH
jgi:hypothetical protein